MHDEFEPVDNALLNIPEDSQKLDQDWNTPYDFGIFPEEDPTPQEDTELLSDTPVSAGFFTADYFPNLNNEQAPPGGDYTAPQPVALADGGSEAAGKRLRPAVIVNTLLLLSALAALSMILFFFLRVRPFENYDRILPNVFCAGVDLSGMTMDEAYSAIEESQKIPDYSVTVSLPDADYEFKPRQDGVVINSHDAARLAYAYGREDSSAFGIYRAYRKALGEEHYVDCAVSLQYNTEDIRNQAIEIYRQTAVSPTESSSEFSPETHQITIHLGNPGKKIDPQTIYDAVCGSFNSMNFQTIQLNYEKTDIDLNQLLDVCNAAAAEDQIAPVEPVVAANTEANSIDVTIGTQGWTVQASELYSRSKAALSEGVYGAVTVDMTAVEPDAPDIAEISQTLTSEPTEPYYYNGVVYEGTDGFTMDLDSAAALLATAGYGQQLSIPLTAVPPEKTAADVEAVLFRDRLSSYTTAHTGESNRTNNLRLACNAIDGTVLNPGEEFSFNDTVGERTAEKGYRSAIVYVGSESVEELGGGICQVASTIYDAALYAELEITQREYHQFFVTYVPGGLDATVYYGSVDFCFRNNTEYPVRINASVSDGYVYISLDGTKTTDHVVELSSSQLSSTPYTTVYERSSKYRKGTEQTTVTPYTGYVYEAYQYIYDGSGDLLETNYLGESIYSKRDRVITIGTG